METAIGMQHMVLAAWAHGVGSCWIDFSGREKNMRTILRIPDHLEPVAMAAFGYPAALPEKKSWKKPVDEIIRFNSF